MALVTETVSINSKTFKHIYSDAGYYLQDEDQKQYVDVYEPSGSTRTFTETTIVAPQTVTQRYFENRLLTKCDLDLSNSTRPHIIETYSSGTEWYRVFSDNWIQQGGTVTTNTTSTVTVTFKKAFKNTNYTITALSNNGNGVPRLSSKSTTYFTTAAANASCSYLWMACGY